jgi:hypothetical protein
MHRTMLLSRRFDERLLSLQRQGRIGTFAPVKGQEAAQIGAVAPLRDDDWMVPSFRETAAAIYRGLPLSGLLLYNAGFNEGSAIPEDHNDLPIAIPVGTQIPHAAGIGYGMRYEGLLDAFGNARVLDTPLAESGIVGFAVGLALYGLRPVGELQFSGFSYLAMHQLESHAARLRWRSQGRFTVPMVTRMPYGAGVRALEHHSESREVYYAHTPGLKMVIPSGPRTARALLVSAIRDPDPVIFFESKLIYRAFREEVPEDDDSLPSNTCCRPVCPWVPMTMRSTCRSPAKSTIC